MPPDRHVYSIVFKQMGIEETLKQILVKQTELIEQVSSLERAVLNQNATLVQLSSADLVRELGITEKTIIQYEKEGRLKSYRYKPGGRKYYKRDEVYAFLNSETKQAERIQKKRRENPLRKVK